MNDLTLNSPEREVQIGLQRSFPLEERVSLALDVLHTYAGIDGDHHKTWVLDQVARALTGPDYEKWIADVKDGKDGPQTYEWDTGVAP